VVFYCIGILIGAEKGKGQTAFAGLKRPRIVSRLRCGAEDEPTDAWHSLTKSLFESVMIYSP
jgi:hypothetical protein